MKSLIGLLSALALSLVQPTSHALPIEILPTVLSGAQEVPPRLTPASGLATFSLNPAHTALSYQLSAFDIENVVAAHIHLGAIGENGPVVAFLFGPLPVPGIDVNGLLATGTITGGDLIGPLAAASFNDFLSQLIAGNTYVNVHTNDGVGEANTGPGDFPGGEIRGQIFVVPEPGTLALLPLALGAIYMTHRRRRQSAQRIRR
jgi:hypothetical protein